VAKWAPHVIFIALRVHFLSAILIFFNQKNFKIMEMEIINLNAAGIDIGSRMFHVAVGQGNDEVKESGVSHNN
jgi:hypothetical protein